MSHLPHFIFRNIPPISTLDNSVVFLFEKVLDVERKIATQINNAADATKSRNAGAKQ